MQLSHNELWERVRRLEGKTVYTKTRQIPNKVLRVTKNWVVIEDKGSVSFTSKAGIFEKYHTLIKDGYLIGKSGEDGMMKANFYDGRYVIMPILHEALPNETEQIKGGIRVV